MPTHFHRYITLSERLSDFSLQCSDTLGWMTGRTKLGVSLLVMTFWLELCTSYSSNCHHHLHHPTTPIKSRMETFWYWLTQVHLENVCYLNGGKERERETETDSRTDRQRERLLDSFWGRPRSWSTIASLSRLRSVVNAPLESFADWVVRDDVDGAHGLH